MVAEWSQKSTSEIKKKSNFLHFLQPKTAILAKYRRYVNMILKEIRSQNGRRTVAEWSQNGRRMGNMRGSYGEAS